MRGSDRPQRILITLAADPRGRSCKPVLRLGVLRKRLGIVSARLSEVLLRLDHLEDRIDAKLTSLHAQIQALLGQLHTVARQSHLILGCVGRHIGLNDLLRDIVVNLLAIEQLASKR